MCTYLGPFDHNTPFTDVRKGMTLKVTNYVRQEAEQDPERSEGSCKASCLFCIHRVSETGDSQSIEESNYVPVSMGRKMCCISRMAYMY